ncbi:MAG TPA: TetR/AcrR family transcriptional regulator [Solimonas sp.]|nr:TetR/AcrR family transcriptional regulator [Solimonas sp.]
MPSRSKPSAFKAVPLPRGRHGLPAEVVRASQRERLVRAMLALVAERGYAATTVPAVVAHARASRNAFYEFFKDKQECFLAACEEAAADVLATMQTFGIEADWLTGVRRGFDVWLRWWEERPGFSMAFLVELPLVGAAAFERRERFFAAFDDLFHRLGDRIRREHPELPPLPAYAPRAVILLVIEMMAQEVRAGGVARLRAIEPALLHLTVKFLADDKTANSLLPQ